jgi:hypothetical protein
MTPGDTIVRRGSTLRIIRYRAFSHACAFRPIQIAELNALNAAMAVIRWKKLFGVYRDARSEVYAGYPIATGEMVIDGTK